MLDLTELYFENDEIKIERLSTKEQAREFIQKSTMIPEFTKMNITKRLEDLFTKKSDTFYLAIEKSSNKILCENLILPASRDFQSYFLISGFHVCNSSVNQYKQIIKFFASQFDDINFLVFVLRNEYIQALEELGFYGVPANDLENYFEKEMLVMNLSMSNLEAIMIKNKKVSYLVH